MIRTALACLAALLPLHAAAKVEVEPVTHPGIGLILVAKVSEEIGPGDYEALLKGLRANPGKFAQKIVMLDSIGGAVPEAMRMGRLLRETGFDALVPSTGICQGTCAYLLAAGHKKTVKGHVGIHRPYFPQGDSAMAARNYGNVRYNAAAYFRDMNIPASLADDMQRIEPSKMRVLSPQELARYRLN